MAEYNIGDKLRKLRQAKKLTLQSVARETGSFVPDRKQQCFSTHRDSLKACKILRRQHRFIV